ncbi:MAG: restriction endonuclease subunit S [Desulfosalsimonadaceae bacterium]
MEKSRIIKYEFYFHKKFGNLPQGWEVTNIGESFDFFPTASFSRSQLSETGDCGYVHYGDIHTKFHRFIDLEKDELPFVSDEMAKRFTKIEEGDLVIADASEDYDGVGKAVEIINIQYKDVIAGLHTLHLRAKEKAFVNGFKGYLLNHEKVRLSILRSATGIKVYSVSKAGLRRILLPKPPKPEQTAIAAILSKVDAAIEATQNSIRAAEKLKKALMQNLLTGKLKPDGAWRTEDEFYVDEKFGKVPKGWNCGALSDISEVIAGQSPAGDTYNDEGKGVPILNGPTEFTDYYPIPVQYTIKPTKICEIGDILFTVRGSSTGRMNFADQEYCIGRGIAAIRANEDSDNDFLYYTLVTIAHKILAEAKGAGSTFPNVNRGDLRKKKIIFPEAKIEQQEIGEKIRAFETKVQSKQGKIHTLQRLKKSLMQHLLTGKVRLPADVVAKLANGQDSMNNNISGQE